MRSVRSWPLALALLALVSLGARAAPPDGGAADGWELVEGDHFQGMITPVGKWRPTREQIDLLEKDLPAFVGANVRVDGRPVALAPPELARYKRQYVGIEPRHKRAIEVHLACRMDGWPHRLVAARGGGACFLVATWDVDAAKFVSVRANSGK